MTSQDKRKFTMSITIKEIEEAIERNETLAFCEHLMEKIKKQSQEHDEDIAEIAERQRKDWEELRELARQNGGWITKQCLRNKPGFFLVSKFLKLLGEGKQREVMDKIGFFRFEKGKWWANEDKDR